MKQSSAHLPSGSPNSEKPHNRRSGFWLTALATAMSFVGAPAIAASHPLDGLSPAEITRTSEILREAGLASEASRYALIELLEPDKATVLNWA
ncbi:MAG: hypothetical protein AB8C46_23595, partial [Burkholderiaceae bacterium]